jgi:hypothetical protein
MRMILTPARESSGRFAANAAIGTKDDDYVAGRRPS